MLFYGLRNDVLMKDSVRERNRMHHNKAPQARLITIAEFPTHYFLEKSDEFLVFLKNQG